MAECELRQIDRPYGLQTQINMLIVKQYALTMFQVLKRVTYRGHFHDREKENPGARS